MENKEHKNLKNIHQIHQQNNVLKQHFQMNKLEPAKKRTLIYKQTISHNNITQKSHKKHRGNKYQIS